MKFHHLAPALSVFALILTTTTLHAAPQNFALNGTLSNGATFTGNVNADTVTGKLNSSSATLTSPSSYFSAISSQSTDPSDPNAFNLSLVDGAGDTLTLNYSSSTLQDTAGAFTNRSTLKLASGASIPLTSGDYSIILSGNPPYTLVSVAGTFANGLTLSGELTLDSSNGTDAGAFLAINTPSSYTFTNFVQFFSTGRQDGIALTSTSTDFPSGAPYFFFSLTNPTQSFTGYNGGPLSTSSEFGFFQTFNTGTPFFNLSSGSATPSPEPTSLLLTLLPLTATLLRRTPRK